MRFFDLLRSQIVDAIEGWGRPFDQGELADTSPVHGYAPCRYGDLLVRDVQESTGRMPV